jgi:SSS family solute:Na+ symporter
VNGYLVLIVAYSALQVAIGVWIGRRVRTTSDFFVAGRRLGPGLLFSTLMAANIGAGSTVGAAGLGYRDGLSAWWWVGSAGLGSLGLAFLVGPRMRRLSAELDLKTVGDYLEHRYHRSVRGAIASLLWLGTLAILAGQLIAVAWILDVVAGVPKWAGCMLGGAVMTAYFTAGGLESAAWVNSLQLVVELSCFALLLPVALSHAGGWHVVASTAPTPDYWGFWRGGQSGWTYAALLAPAFVISPGLVQKVYGARDERTVRVGVGLNAIVLLLFAFVPTLLGMLARARHPGLTNHELALPTVLRYDLPAAFGAFGLAAIFSTEVNTADAILFMLSTSLSQDLYRGFVNRSATDAQVLRVARWAAVAGGTFGVALAIAAPSVIDALRIFYSLLSVSLFVPLVAGLYVRRVGTPEAAAAIGCGVSLMLLSHLATGGRGWGAVSPAAIGLVASALACAAVAFGRYHRAPALQGGA